MRCERFFPTTDIELRTYSRRHGDRVFLCVLVTVVFLTHRRRYVNISFILFSFPIMHISSELSNVGRSLLATRYQRTGIRFLIPYDLLVMTRVHFRHNLCVLFVSCCVTEWIVGSEWVSFTFVCILKTSRMPVTVDTERVVAVGDILNDKHRSLAERFRALFTLRNIGGRTAVDCIAACFGDASALLKHELAYCLGQMQDTYAIPTLVAVLKDVAQEPMVRHEAGVFFVRCPNTC